ncbi:ABC transporter [Microbacterium oxydans]|uniref:ABC transporter n=1 Tax=Microbacterium sp. B19(2022) TaxID=2914045 RepID=UPI00142FEBF3|nr:ABC transporter [Microbacterium sp. B19(2022)]NJI59487.1 ABC transporter [Microbacterium sp. B19(2022)]
MNPPLRRTASVAAALTLLLAFTACAPTAPPTPDASAPDAHGIDAGGAAEVASPARALVIADRRGELTLLDLATEERATLAPGRSGITGIFGDGRLVYRAHDTEGGTAVEVFDSARWTVPHGDHTHSFRGAPQTLGILEGEGDVTVVAGEQRATVAFAGGELVLLAHDALAEGLEAAPRVTVDAAGAVAPLAGHLLVPTAGATIELLDPAGDRVPDAAVACADPRDVDLTRVGAVFSCAEGAVLFSREVGGTIAAEAIPYPANALPASSLSGRADRPDLAGVAGEQGAWLLDVRQRQWMLLPSDVPLLQAAALGDDDSRTVAIDADGRVRVLAPDGTVLAHTEPLLAASVTDPALRDRVQLLVDAQHAYVSDPATGAVHEIDHGDGTVTRTFADLDPWSVQQVG